jgi:glycosyltransferase involved in cell wall biosynthesis
VRQAKIKTVLVSNSARAYKATRVLKAQSPNVKIIDVLHGDHGGYPEMSASFNANLDCTVVVSRYLKNYLVHQHRMRSDHVEVIHNGIDTKGVQQHRKGISRYRQRLGIPPNVFVVAYIGRFAAEKRPDRVLESFSGLRRMAPSSPMKLVMVGDGELRGALTDQASTLALDDDVHFTGYIDDVPILLAEIDALVLTSETEGIPMVVLEAMALGVPVVATAVGGVPEIIEPGRSGLLVRDDEKAVEGIQNHLLGLLEDSSWCHRLGRGAIQRVQMEFSLARMVQKYVALL